MSLPNVPSAETAIVYGFVVTFVLVAVVVPTVLLSRYLGLTNELRIFARRTRIDRSTAVVATLATAAWFAAVRSFGPFPDGDWFAAGAASFLAGVVALSVAAGNYDWYRSTDVPVQETGFVHEGPIQVSGEARPVDEPLDGPFSEEPCLAYAISVQERRWMSSGQRPIAVDAAATRFYVDDGSGGLLVDPAEADVLVARPTDLLGRDVTLRVDGDESPPAHVRSSFDELGIRPSSNDRTYREAHLQPGDEVYVVGSCRSVGYGYDANRVVADASDVPAFVVTSGDVDDVSSSVRRLVRRSAAVGATLALVGVLSTSWLAL